jgi:hypothetical protein
MINYNIMKVAIQRFMSDILKDKYNDHQEIIDRISHYLVTEADVKKFGAMVADIYQLGFTQATSDYTKKLSEQGFNFEVVPADSRRTGGGQRDSK